MAEERFLELGDFELELGGSLPDARLAYRVIGTLAPARDNAILFPHMYSGTSASLDGWIGPGRALDPDRWCVICPDQLGSGRSSSPSNTRGPFPDLTIGDDVCAQERLLETLGIERLALVVGYSMGAQQAYEWAVRSPGSVCRLACIAGLARTTAANALLVDASVEALRGGGAGAHARFWAATGLSADFFRCEGWRAAGFASVADLVKRLFEDDYAGPDPADLLCQLGKWRRADVARHTGGDLQAALARIEATTLVVGFSHDAWFPAADCEAEQRSIPDSKFRLVESLWGHYAWGPTPAEVAQIEALLREFLAT